MSRVLVSLVAGLLVVALAAGSALAAPSEEELRRLVRVPDERWDRNAPSAERIGLLATMAGDVPRLGPAMRELHSQADAAVNNGTPHSRAKLRAMPRSSRSAGSHVSHCPQCTNSCKRVA